MSGGAVEHLVPVVEIIALSIGALVALAIGMWRGFRWLDEQMTSRFRVLISEFTSSNDRRHELHDRAIDDLRARDEERADAIKRLHGRVDNVLERIAGAP